MDLNLGGSKKKQHHAKKKYSIITLDLFKPTKKSYPEFDYEKICKEYLNEDESSGEDERFHDREAEELVRRLEQKYGGKRDKHGRKIRFGCPDDYMDKTAGYDLTDPFIDDTEAYDEHVPSALDTARGGFYVNKGKLEFKSKYAEDDSDSSDEGTTTKKKTPEKRRRISSDEETDDSKRLCASPPTKQHCDNIPSSLGSESGVKNLSSVRLSSAGAAPTAKPSDVPRNRFLTSHYIKKRRLLGQPPTAKISHSATVKAAMDVKKKLKPQTKKPTIGMTTDDLSGLLNDVTGGEMELMDCIDGVMKEISEEKEQFNKKPISTSLEYGASDKSIIIPFEKAAPTAMTPGSRVVVSPSSSTGPKRSPGRPPGSTSQPKPMPVMSDKLRGMIDIYKQKTKEFGAPNKKIRLPPSLVDLCIRIEEQCTSESFNHQQKTRVFDLLANWVCVQRNSLYIRMKAHRDRHELNPVSESDVNIDEPVNETKETTKIATDEKVHDINDSSTSAIAVSSSPAISEPSGQSSFSIKKDHVIGIKNTGKNDAAKPSTVTQSSLCTKELNVQVDAASATSTATAFSLSTSKRQDSLVLEKTVGNQSATQNLSTKPVVTAANMNSSLQNAQFLSVLATMMQQNHGDNRQQEQHTVDNLMTKMSAPLLSAKQQSELSTQYHVALNNLAKLAATATTTANSVSSAPGPLKPTDLKTDAQTSKSQSKSGRLHPVGSATLAIPKRIKQPLLDEKATHAANEINSVLAQVMSEVEKALAQTESEYLKEKIRAEKEGKPTPTKCFVWSDSLRAVLKKQMTLLFTSIEEHGDLAHIVSPTIVHYLYHTVRPLFKDLVKFRELIVEILRLCPEKRQLVLIPEIKTLIELDYASKTQSGTQAISKAKKVVKSEIQPRKTAHSKGLPDVDISQTSTAAVANSRSLTVVGREQSDQKNCGRENSFGSIPNETGDEKTEKVRISSPKTSEILVHMEREVHIQKHANSSRSSVVVIPKLTPGQRVMLARENREREKLQAEKAAAEKARKEREEAERKLQEQKEVEEAENKKRDEEAIKKWEQEEAERLESSREEVEEDNSAFESVHFGIRPEEMASHEIDEVELGTDTEADMNTEEDVNMVQKNGGRMSNSDSEQTCSSIETEQPSAKKITPTSILSEQSSPQTPSSISCTYAMSLSSFTHSGSSSHVYSMSQHYSQNNEQKVHGVYSKSLSPHRHSSSVPENFLQQLPSASAVPITESMQSSQMSQCSNFYRQQLSPLEQAMREIISIPSPLPQVSSFQSFSQQQQQLQQHSWVTKQPGSSTLLASSNNYQIPSSHPTQSFTQSTSYSSGFVATTQIDQQQTVSISSSAVSQQKQQQQQQQIHYKNPQIQYVPATIQHGPQILVQQQRSQERPHQQRPYNYSASVAASNSFQKATSTLPTCSMPQTVTQTYADLPSQQVTYQQRSDGDACSSAFLPLPSSPNRHEQQQLINHNQLAYGQQYHHHRYHHHHHQQQQQHSQQQQQQQQQQFVLQQRQRQLFVEQQQHQPNAMPAHRQMYGNWQ